MNLQQYTAVIKMVFDYGIVIKATYLAHIHTKDIRRCLDTKIQFDMAFSFGRWVQSELVKIETYSLELHDTTCLYYSLHYCTSFQTIRYQ